jgi:kinesin family protein 4/21/27
MGTSNALAQTPSEQMGVIPRAVEDIFYLLSSTQHRWQARISFLELYNEELIDLLAPDDAPSNNLQIREDAQGNIYWFGVREVLVQSAYEVMQQLTLGSEKRRVGATDMNEQSSRSHAIFSISIRQEKDNSGSPKNEWRRSTPVTSRRSFDASGDAVVLNSKFHFVDLAGSERLKRTNAVGDRAKEGISINQGLSALGNVISVLGDPAKRGAHIPYRDSKLTRLLQDSLGGNRCILVSCVILSSQTVMIACLSPAGLNHAETIARPLYNVSLG